MMSFVRKGDERCCPVQDSSRRKFQQYVQEFAPKDITIFKGRPNMSPFLHCHSEVSLYIGAYNACSALLYYCSHLKKGANEDEAIATIKKKYVSVLSRRSSGTPDREFYLH
jgi:hypothetical protein